MKVLDFIKKKIFFHNDKEKEDSQEKEETVNHIEEKKEESWFNKIKFFWGNDDKVVDDEILDKLEETFISADVGVDTTCEIISKLESLIQNKKIRVSELNLILKDIISDLVEIKEEKNLKEKKIPWIIMVIGVNGVGKTTTIGKLANLYQQEGKSVVIGAADTFRAGAVSQLKSWCDSANVMMIEGENEKTNPSTVAFNTVQYAMKNQIDVAIIDTAGRLQNKIGLMDELSKIKRVIKNLNNDAPQEIFLILDASTGQNIFSQLDSFIKMIDVTGMIVTKMDGIAKSGFLIGAINKFKIPVEFIGTGEKINDLYYFDTKKFIDHILNN